MKNLENIWSHSNCLSQEQMQQYLEQNLDTEQTLQMESHIADCMFCSDALEGLQQQSNTENATAINDIKNHIDALLFPSTEEAQPVQMEEPPMDAEPKMTVKKGGKRISIAAAAGLFLLIFGAGLAVFSYIDNNTNWFSPKNETVVTTKGDANDKDPKLNHSSSSGQELETITISEEDLDLEAPKPVENSRQKNPLPARKNNQKSRESAAPKPQSALNKNEAVVAKNDKTANDIGATDELAEDASQSTGYRYDNSSMPQGVAKEAEKKPAIAQTKVQDNYSNLAERNAYDIPKYDGKLKDIKQTPAVTKVDRDFSKSGKKVSKYKSQQNVSKKEIDAIQAEGLGNYYNTAADNLTKANKAFDKGDYKQSIKLYKRVLREKNLKNRQFVLYQLALAYEKTNNVSKAEKIFEELEDNAPFQDRARSGLKRLRAR